MSTDLRWFKSSYSSGEGECVEAALGWTKSSYSGSEGECLEAATCPNAIHIRDSKQTHTPAAGPTVTVTAHTWTTFLAALG